MPSDERNTDDPPRGQSSARFDAAAWRQLAAEVQRQADGLAQLRYEPTIRHEMLRYLQERRRGADVTQFDYLPSDVGFDPLVVRGELLITRESAERDRSRLEALGLRAERQECAEQGCEELHDQVLRLTHREGPDHMGHQQRADLAKTLRSRGTSAALTAASTNAAVVKSTGGPRPVQAQALSTSPGEGPKVAIIDTGISEQRSDTVSPQSQLDVLHEFPLGNTPAEVEQRKKYLSLDAGHGTFVTGIVQQLAPHADITVYRALDSDGIGSEVGIACAMIRAVKDGNQIINLSLGCQTQDDYPPLAIYRAIELIREWERANNQEILVIAAAGNYGDTRPCWPAAFRSVVSVAALAPDLTPARWSSRGFWVMCSTIGQGISSTFVEGTESPFYASPSSVPPVPLAEFHGRPPWAAWNGTSFAAPQIAGKLVQLCQTSGQSPRAALRGLLAGGRPLPEFGQAIAILPGT